MTSAHQPPLRVAVACGGTGGHLFPGLAVAECLLERGCEVALVVSPKEVDQKAVKGATGMEVVTLPAIGLARGQRLAFWHALWRSYRTMRDRFRALPTRGVIAMGGFTAAGPVLAAKRCGAASFLHESNTIPGRANRLLARLVDEIYVGFPTAAKRLRNKSIKLTGTPVRAQFQVRDAESCRRSLGFEPNRPLGLVMGGSQGARGINELVTRTLPLLASSFANWQWLHLTGSTDFDAVRNAYTAANLRAKVHPLLAEMDLAMSAATVAIGRAGASSLAELAAVRLPAVLVPYPAATDNHQFHNAQAFAETGAALVLEQRSATPEALVTMLGKLAHDKSARQKMETALATWHTPAAAERIAASMLEMINAITRRMRSPENQPAAQELNNGEDHPTARRSVDGVARPAHAGKGSA